MLGPPLLLALASPRAFKPGWPDRLSAWAAGLVWFLALALPAYGSVVMLRNVEAGGVRLGCAIGFMLYMLFGGTMLLMSLDRRKRPGMHLGFGAFICFALCIAWTVLLIFLWFVRSLMTPWEKIQFLAGPLAALLLLFSWLKYWRAVAAYERT